MGFSEILSIISLIISTTIAIWNIIIQRKDKLKDERRKEEEKKKEIFDSRPRFSIESFANESQEDLNVDYDLNILIANIENSYSGNFFYSDKVKNKNCWKSISFKFKNIGKSDISYLRISTNYPRSTAVFDINNDRHVSFIKEHCFEVAVSFDRIIRPNEYFTLKINYIEKINGFRDISTFTIWMKDEYNRIWSQSLFENSGNIYDSKQETIEDYNKYTRFDDVLRYFHGL